MTDHKWTGRLAVSMAGNDRGRIYCIVREEDPYLWLSDGKHRKLSAPKKKKRKHAGLIKHLPDSVREYRPQQTEGMSDADIRRIISLYKESRLESKM